MFSFLDWVDSLLSISCIVSWDWEVPGIGSRLSVVTGTRDRVTDEDDEVPLSVESGLLGHCLRLAACASSQTKVECFTSEKTFSNSASDLS